MSGLLQIEQTLERTTRRRRLDRALKGLWSGVFWGSILFLATLVVYKLLPIPVACVMIAGAAAGAAIVGGFVYGYWRKPTRQATARWIDERQHLKERLSTALELNEDSRAGRWGQLVVEDAVRHASDLNPARLLPFHLTRAARWSVLVLVLAAGLGFVPEYRSKEFLKAKNDEAIIKETGRVLTELTRRTLEQRPPVLEPTEKALENVSETGLELTKGSLKRDDALKDLASAADKLTDQLKEMAKNPALRKMDQALRRQESGQATTPGEVQKKLDELQKSLGEAAGKEDALDKMQKELADLKQKAAQMSNEAGGMSEQAKQEMAQKLAELSRQAQQMGANLPGLEAAMQAMMANQTDYFLKDLDMAMADLEKMQQMAEAMQKLQQDLAKLGKDLAEQLKMGQANAAIETLHKMQDQLKKSGMSEEQMAKLMEELNKSLKPAEGYGKVSDKLAKALAECKGGNKSGASESLAAAAKELEDLLAQMGDLDSMMASLEALKAAQMCIGNGQCLGMGQCLGFGRGKGKKMGRGFGTWADENGWTAIPQISDLWENSEDNRNLAAKGLTDRGDGELVDGLNPTKVRGQMSPGGNMPSITLKGVSIKGQSRVNLQQAVVAAQTDAQSALADDKVPRAYQSAVRNYFDELK